MSQTALKIHNALKPSSSLARNRRILIVEDEPSIAEAYQDILGKPIDGNVVAFPRSSRSKGAGDVQAAVVQEPEFELTVVHSAIDAQLAVEIALRENRPFTMGFIDVLLGTGKDGIELVKDLHAIDEKLFAVFVTAYSDRSVQSIQNLLGQDATHRWDYLNKPFTHGEILQKARNGVAYWNVLNEHMIKDNEIAALQSRLLEKERASSLSAVARGVGHEFGNILTQILGRAELSENLPEAEMRVAIQQILKASHRAADILDGFKDLAKSGSIKRERTFVAINDILQESIDLLSHQLDVANVKVVHLPSVHVEVHCDSTGLLQVFVNLVINAIHAMPGSGQLDISVQPHEDGCEIRLRDYGQGADPKILPQMTEAFFTTKGSSGTGLGLAICKEIIEIDHEGSLIFRNHPGGGLEVIIQLPKQSTGGNVDGGFE